MRNAAGAVTAEYWRGTLAPRPFVDWYLERIERACGALDDERGDAIALVAHSAGVVGEGVRRRVRDGRAREVGGETGHARVAENRWTRARRG